VPLYSSLLFCFGIGAFVLPTMCCGSESCPKIYRMNRFTAANSGVLEEGSELFYRFGNFIIVV
jgi:hypothetical protein